MKALLATLAIAITPALALAQSPPAPAKPAVKAALELGYTRMWSIHPDQIRPILEAFAPTAHEIEIATKLIAAAAQADWAPISFKGKLEDRASYRYYWQVLERAHRTGRKLPREAQAWLAEPLPP